MSLISSWVLIQGWEAFQRLQSTHPEEFRRLLRQPQHFLTPDGTRFAPVRLLREMGTGLDFPIAQKDPVPFSRLEPELQAQGWIIEREGSPGFDRTFAAWEAYCLSFGPKNGPRNWSGTDPRKHCTFTVPSSP